MKIPYGIASLCSWSKRNLVELIDLEFRKLIWKFQSVKFTATALLPYHGNSLQILQFVESVETPLTVQFHYLFKSDFKTEEHKNGVKENVGKNIFVMNRCLMVNLLTLTCNRTFDSSIGHANTALIIPAVQPLKNTWPNQYFCCDSVLGVLWNDIIMIVRMTAFLWLFFNRISHSHVLKYSEWIAVHTKDDRIQKSRRTQWE